jgi:hypothetical protein
MSTFHFPATLAAWIFAVAFAATALVGFLPNPLVGEDALFVTNTAHNLVHLFTAVAFGLVATFGDRASTLFMRVFGVVYLGVGVLGFVVLGAAPEGHLLGIVHINRLDNFLHVGLGLGILAAGFLAVDRRQLQATS